MFAVEVALEEKIESTELDYLELGKHGKMAAVNDESSLSRYSTRRSKHIPLSTVPPAIGYVHSKRTPYMYVYKHGGQGSRMRPYYAAYACSKMRTSMATATTTTSHRHVSAPTTKQLRERLCSLTTRACALAPLRGVAWPEPSLSSSPLFFPRTAPHRTACDDTTSADHARVRVGGWQVGRERRPPGDHTPDDNLIKFSLRATGDGVIMGGGRCCRCGPAEEEEVEAFQAVGIVGYPIARKLVFADCLHGEYYCARETRVGTLRLSIHRPIHDANILREESTYCFFAGRDEGGGEHSICRRHFGLLRWRCVCVCVVHDTSAEERASWHCGSAAKEDGGNTNEPAPPRPPALMIRYRTIAGAGDLGDGELQLIGFA
ncbi:hypothetical protein EDC01DRAFT_749160 [Geopyxis carbonaria]|nr:hypothetical protein EDC01DRAFT_749160 [Geopyxis carbonaria]